MSSAGLSRAALELSSDEHLELARRLVESVTESVSLKEAVVEGIRRIQAVASVRGFGLIEKQYCAALR